MSNGDPTKAPFVVSHDEAAERFRDSVSEVGLQLRQCSVRSADEKSLTIDVAMHTPPHPVATLLISGGLHGVEGIFGSAVQRNLLRQFREAELPPHMRIVMVHCLNPWGYIHGRRTDEANRDLNRNFLLAGEEYGGSPPLYGPLDGFLNPQERPTWDLFFPRALGLIARHGFTALKRAIAEGQYDFPNGLFFGGHEPAQIMNLLGNHWADWIGESNQIIHLDLHTGLGKPMTWKLLPDGHFSDAAQSLFRESFGPHSFVPSSENSGGYQTRGGMGRWCESQCSESQNYTYACAEFGTHPALRVLRALRLENCCHHLYLNERLDSTDQVFQNAKAQLREAFCPSSEQWRKWAVEQGTSLIKTILQHLCSR